MDYEFESIIPWNGEHDTGRDARQKLDRNFAKIKANFQELAGTTFVTTAFFARIFGIDGEDGAEVDINDTEAVITAVKVKFGLYSESFVSAKGLNPDAGSTPGGGGSTTLASLTDVSITTTPKDGQVLAYDAALDKWRPMDMEATAGIDEAQLAQYLTTNNYAKKADITAALDNYALKTTRIIAGTGLTGGGTLAQNVTLSLATVGTAGTYTKVTVDAYGRVTGHGSLAAADIPALAISKITGLQAELNSKLDAADFEELFEKVWVSGYGYAIRAKLAFYSEGWISAKGLNSDAGSTTGGVDENEVLQIVEDAGYIKSSALSGYATQNWVRGMGYATQSWVNSQGYMSQSTADGRYFRTNISTLPDDDLSSIPTGASGSYIVPYPNWNGSAFVFLAGSSNSNIGFLFKGGQQAASAKINLIATNDSNPSKWADLGALVTSGNYTDYTVTKTGSGASGTWGIGISGNAATATRLQTARTLWGQPFNGTDNVSGSLTGVANITMSGSIMADGTIDSQNFVLGKALSSISNFPRDVFGSTGFGYKLTAIRWNGSGYYGLNYSPMIAIATSDTHAYITISYLDASTCYIGGGNGTTITWQAKLFNDSMNLIPKNSNYSVGSASIPWYEMYAARFIASDFLQVGSARLYYNTANKAIFVEMADGSQCGFYATGFMSAKGLNSDGGSAVAGATTLNGLSDVTISSPVNGQSLVYRNGVWRNEMVSGGGGSASVAWGDITGKPTWIGSSKPSYAFSEITGTPSLTISSNSSTNLTVNVEGASKSISSLYATYSTYANYLRTARTIWGQSFNGGSNISGNMTGVGSITASGVIKGTQMFSTHNDMLLFGPYSNNRVLSFGWSSANGDYMTYWIPGAVSHDDIRMELVQNIRGIMVYDNIRYKGTCSASSDMRLKEKLGDLDLTVAQVAAAPSFRFKWRNRNETAIGSSVQYWVDILPDAVCKDTDDYLMMAYGNLALAAVITTARTVIDHEQRIRRLEDALKVAV